VPRKLPIPGPLHKLKDTAVGAVKDPLGTSGRLFGQAKDAATLGRHLAEGLATTVAEQVGTRTRGRRSADAPHAASPAEAHADTHATPSSGPRQVHGDPVAPHTPHPAADAPSAEPVPSTEARVSAKKASPADVAKKAAKKAPAKKTSAKKTPAKKAAKKTAKKTPPDGADASAPDAPGDKLPPRAPDNAPPPPPPPPAVEPNPEATPPG
jgi:hypothetical protein